jgi:hypothetical protein
VLFGIAAAVLGGGCGGNDVDVMVTRMNDVLRV